MDLRLPAAAALLGLAAAAAERAESARATPRPPAGLASVLGGFTAVAAQAVWMRADRAVVERDEDRAVVLLRALVDLQPEVVSASRFAAQEIGWNMLQGHDDPDVRWSLVQEALGILTNCVTRNPASAEALVHRGRYLSLKVAGEEALAERYAAAEGGRHPLAAACADFEEALRRAPDDGDAAAGLALAAGLRGRRAAAAERWDEAAEALRASERAYVLVLGDARAELGPEIASGGPEADALRSTEEALSTLRDLLAAIEGDPAGRAARVAEFERLHPGVLR